MIDIALKLSVSDTRRRFDLDIAFATDAPFVALYGPSGAGKSLTLQAMAGLLPVRAGHVKLNGRVLLDSAAGIALPPEARGVGYLFQHYALFPHLSVRDNIAFGLTSWRRRLQPEDAARVDELIEAFGLATLARSKPATLSGGQQQRVALARALACNPQVLLLDEPFAALHSALRRELRDELKRVRARWGIPAVMVSHDADDVVALAEEVFLFDGGHVTDHLVAGRDDLRARLA
ncbi:MULTISPECIES: ATP-binding cassette domain-containing protein [unclassified Roseateles]|uniref:ATP-binding cassette domain-containing protein n=1 Tax=unclassified Roseateles TaxID=2626991 RepID=UPI0006F762A6|nr:MULTISPECIES: ATP-binding cassette domain-containing protein [unclassified Roseateles]KQW42286.1 ABC transporter ATP-binding protein [Pelomonas sp. Root405]KRA68160.1 ABC transporter ATP-binding protein [Pelomonas sp. Root662]